MDEGDTTVFGMRFELGYEYLKSTDLDWLFTTLRSELLPVVKDRMANKGVVSKRIRLVFEVTHIQTGNSVTLDVIPFVESVGSGVLSIILYEAMRLLYHRWRQTGGVHRLAAGRVSIHHMRTYLISKRVIRGRFLSKETVIEEKDAIVIRSEEIVQAEYERYL
jgi:hypothetical protein